MLFPVIDKLCVDTVCFALIFQPSGGNTQISVQHIDSFPVLIRARIPFCVGVISENRNEHGGIGDFSGRPQGTAVPGRIDHSVFPDKALLAVAASLSGFCSCGFIQNTPVSVLMPCSFGNGLLQKDFIANSAVSALGQAACGAGGGYRGIYRFCVQAVVLADSNEGLVTKLLHGQLLTAQGVAHSGTDRDFGMTVGKPVIAWVQLRVLVDDDIVVFVIGFPKIKAGLEFDMGMLEKDIRNICFFNFTTFSKMG